MINWQLGLLFFSALFGGAGVFLVQKNATRQLKLILSFSGAYLFAITVLHLIPDLYETHDPSIGVYILIGFFFQIFLEQFSEGIEHGHIHVHHHHVAFPYGIMISLCLHAFLEGMPLIENQHNQLVVGIALHHIPAAFALGSVLMQNRVKRSYIIVLLILFALMSPLGLYTSKALSSGIIGNLSSYFNKIMAVVIGIFLHISTTILFESSQEHRFNLYKAIAVLIGAGIALAAFFMQPVQ